jgi:hypothetical protein
MGIWAFFSRHFVPSVVTAFGAIWAGIGIVSQAYDVWTAGLEPWAVQLSGFIIFVVGVVAMLYQFGQIAPQPAGAFPTAVAAQPERLTLSQESPDISLKNAAKIIADSTWAEEHGAKLPDILRELADKLGLHQLTAFGRVNSTARIEPIPWRLWAEMEIRAEGSVAVNSKTKAVVYEDLQFDRAYVNGLWPGEHNWMT